MNIILFEKHKTILNINALLCFCKDKNIAL